VIVSHYTADDEIGREKDVELTVRIDRLVRAGNESKLVRREFLGGRDAYWSRGL
jgi:hypothetical protein